MTSYFKKINLTCENEIREFSLAQISNQLKDNTWGPQIRIKHSLPDALLDKINQELSSYNFPNVLYCQTYIRKKGNFQGIHLDGTNGETISAAINIPIYGCSNSKFIWYDGNYQKFHRQVGDLVFYSLYWKEKPIEATSLELTSAHLVRVDKPHSALASDVEDRAIFTMRFKGNPSFEELIKNL